MVLKKKKKKVCNKDSLIHLNKTHFEKLSTAGKRQQILKWIKKVAP